MEKTQLSGYSGTRLIAMDLDGTLTQHKSPLAQECREVLEGLSHYYSLLMVCAGSCERVYNQMGAFPIDIIGFYGMQLSSVVDGVFSILEDHKVKIDNEAVFARAETIRNEFGLLDYDGEPVEYHASGMITFPILGTAAPLEKKLAYDPDRKKRRQYYARVCEVFSDCSVFIGGTSSFDIAPPPYNKLYAIDRYLSKKGLGRKDAIYFGDDYGAGGNDRDIYDSEIGFVRIDDYRAFPEIAKRLLPEHKERKI